MLTMIMPLPTTTTHMMTIMTMIILIIMMTMMMVVMMLLAPAAPAVKAEKGQSEAGQNCHVAAPKAQIHHHCHWSRSLQCHQVALVAKAFSKKFACQASATKDKDELLVQGDLAIEVAEALVADYGVKKVRHQDHSRKRAQ
jgi:short subunit fatty acids transporter